VCSVKRSDKKRGPTGLSVASAFFGPQKTLGHLPRSAITMAWTNLHTKTRIDSFFAAKIVRSAASIKLVNRGLGTGISMP
jgi:hypothetical protein